MSGTYRILVGGEEVARGDNLITTQGRTALLRYLSGQDPSWAGAIGIGSGAIAPTVNDTKPQFEFARAEVDWREADLVNYRVIVRATIPLEVSGQIHEIGLWSTALGGDREAPGMLITDFADEHSTVTGGSVETTDVRVGSASRRATLAASANATISHPYFTQDFTFYEQTDELSLAYFLYDANAASIEIRFKKDDANYYAYSFAPGTTLGYNVHNWTKSSFIATGTLTWADITSMDIILSAGAGGASNIVLDGLRITDTDQYDGYYFVSRALISPAWTKSMQSEMQIEYALPFSL